MQTLPRPLGELLLCLSVCFRSGCASKEPDNVCVRMTTERQSQMILRLRGVFGVHWCMVLEHALSRSGR